MSQYTRETTPLIGSSSSSVPPSISSLFAPLSQPTPVSADIEIASYNNFNNLRSGKPIEGSENNNVDNNFQHTSKIKLEKNVIKFPHNHKKAKYVVVSNLFYFILILF